MLEITGRFVPIVTPFTDDGATVSEVRLARLLRFYVKNGAEGFMLASETGEFSTLSGSERKHLLELTQRDIQGALPVVTNVTTLSTSSSLDLAQHAARHGARAVVLIPPYFGDLTQAEHIAHVRVISSHSNLPILLADPKGALKEEATAAISHFPNVHMVWPHPEAEKAHADWFRCYNLTVDPMAGVPDSKSSDFVLRNRAAVAKTLLVDADLEVGSPRMPVQPVPYRDIRKAA
jgi:hypothetical protein